MDFTPVSKSAASHLDPFSTSQTSFSGLACAVSDSEPEKSAQCEYGAPLIAYQKDGGVWGIVQATCNHWDCKRCGPLIAKKHYGRIVEGCRELHKAHGALHFITITCRGRGLARKDAEENYLTWTNRLMTALRMDAKRKGKPWAYVQVTERQKRGHPHSHIITPYYPDDLTQELRYRYKHDNAGKRKREYYKAWRSAWLQARSISAGLGSEYDVSIVEDVEAVSRYVAKYLFKDTLQTVWPKGWKRVRYSQGWWDYPDGENQAMALISADDYEAFAEVVSQARASGLDDNHVRKLEDGLWRSSVVLFVDGKLWMHRDGVSKFAKQAYEKRVEW